MLHLIRHVEKLKYNYWLYQKYVAENLKKVENAKFNGNPAKSKNKNKKCKTAKEKNAKKEYKKWLIS